MSVSCFCLFGQKQLYSILAEKRGIGKDGVEKNMGNSSKGITKEANVFVQKTESGLFEKKPMQFIETMDRMCYIPCSRNKCMYRRYKKGRINIERR